MTDAALTCRGEEFLFALLLRIVQEQRVTVVQMVPTMFVRLLALPAKTREAYDISSLRRVVHAAAVENVGKRVTHELADPQLALRAARTVALMVAWH